jgi:hypothetical protein
MYIVEIEDAGSPMRPTGPVAQNGMGESNIRFISIIGVGMNEYSVFDLAVAGCNIPAQFHGLFRVRNLGFLHVGHRGLTRPELTS